MKALHKPTQDWTVVLRRQPVRIVDGQPEGGYTSMFELICCDCGDHPERDYREVPPELQRIPRAVPDRGGRGSIYEARRGAP